MVGMLDGRTRRNFAKNATRLGQTYSFAELVGSYEAIYAAAIEHRGSR